MTRKEDQQIIAKTLSFDTSGAMTQAPICGATTHISDEFHEKTNDLNIKTAKYKKKTNNTKIELNNNNNNNNNTMTSMNHHLTQLENYIKKYYPTLKGADLTTITDIIYMSALRNNITISELCNDLYNGILYIDSYYEANSGNIYDYIKDPKYEFFAERIKDIIVGSNGGMANVGKGEWLISLGCGIDPNTDKPYVIIIKNGQGDLEYREKKEELKWNGGKADVGKAGNQINKKFNTLIDIQDKQWVPFRKRDKKIYSIEEIKKYNSIYWKAISDNETTLLSDDELKQKIINMAFIKVFEKSDSFIMFNENGKFQRFYNIEDVNIYYRDKLHLLTGNMGFECRANQSNPIALYCNVL